MEMGSLSIMHWALVILVLLMVFGTKKLSTVGKDLGAAVRDFKAGIAEVEAKPEDKPKA